MVVSTPPNLSENQLNTTELRPWGSFTELDENFNHDFNMGYKILRVEIKPSHRQSLQLHYHRCEHIIVISGVAKITRGKEELMLSPGESTFIPRFRKHRIENPGKIPLIMIVTEQGEYLGLDDITRYEDDYSR